MESSQGCSFKVPNTIKEVPNTLKDVPNTAMEVPKTVKDVPNTVKDVPSGQSLWLHVALGLLAIGCRLHRQIGPAMPLQVATGFVSSVALKIAGCKNA